MGCDGDEAGLDYSLQFALNAANQYGKVLDLGVLL
jgi:hypothetical protein